MKKVLLVTPYFLPSALAGVHRVRIMASHLVHCGFAPLIVTVDGRYYPTGVDLVSLHLLPENIEMEHVNAWPTALSRLIGIGDVSIRAQFSMRRKVAELVRAGKASLIFVTVLPGFGSLIGAWAKRRFGLPYVLDYQDPWSSDWGASQPRWSKNGISHTLAEYFEAKVLPTTDAVTAVSDGTLDGLRRRKLLTPAKPTAVVPIGAEVRDHEVAREHGRSLIPSKKGFKIAYIGTVADRMVEPLAAVLQAIKAAVGTEMDVTAHLIGTSGSADGVISTAISKLLEDPVLQRSVTVHPQRVGYLDALKSMQNADVLLVIGSMDAHYTASKLFPYWLAGKPVVALVHAESSAVRLGRELGGVVVVTYDRAHPPSSRIGETAAVLRRICRGDASTVPPRNTAAFAPYSGRGIAEQFARVFSAVSSCASAS